LPGHPNPGDSHRLAELPRLRTRRELDGPYGATYRTRSVAVSAEARAGIPLPSFIPRFPAALLSEIQIAAKARREVGITSCTTVRAGTTTPTVAVARRAVHGPKASQAEKRGKEGPFGHGTPGKCASRHRLSRFSYGLYGTLFSEAQQLSRVFLENPLGVIEARHSKGARSCERAISGRQLQA
jgi:hypothetical protein